MLRRLTLDQIDGPYLDIAYRLIRRAGYDPAQGVSIQGGQFHAEFEALLIALAYIGGRKTDDYGDFRMQDIRSWDRETWGAYWDIQRKFGRLEQQLPHEDREIPDNAPTVNMDDLMETLGDMAVYCVRMIQILKRLETKGMVPK